MRNLCWHVYLSDLTHNASISASSMCTANFECSLKILLSQQNMNKERRKYCKFEKNLGSTYFGCKDGKKVLFIRPFVSLDLPSENTHSGWNVYRQKQIEFHCMCLSIKWNLIFDFSQKRPIPRVITTIIICDTNWALLGGWKDVALRSLRITCKFHECIYSIIPSFDIGYHSYPLHWYGKFS